MEAMDRVKKEQRPHPFVQVLATATELVELGARAEQGFSGGFAAARVERLVACLRVGVGDEAGETSHAANGEKLTERVRSVNRRAKRGSSGRVRALRWPAHLVVGVVALRPRRPHRAGGPWPPKPARRSARRNGSQREPFHPVKPFHRSVWIRTSRQMARNPALQCAAPEANCGTCP